jgi:hypothetical protein
MHRYKSLSGDAELYAVQAMARIQPWLADDLFLQDVSQDRYTVFSPLYAWCIERVGLRSAALILTLACKLWLFAAAWALARNLTNSRAAFMAVAIIIITAGTYGAFGVFQFAEDWLTARSLAEALVVSAFVLHFYGLRLIALLLGSFALFVHPLMAFPGLLLLACLWCSLRVDIAAIAVGVIAALGIGIWSTRQPYGSGLLMVMDPEWTEVVRERSVFLFLQHWHTGDWCSNARPFLTLTLSAMALNNDRVRKLCIVSMLVGAAGLVVALIASTIGPVAILLQGQAWRWVWITCFVGVLLLPATATAIYADSRGGPLGAVLLIAGWTLPAVGGSAFITLALLLRLSRERIDSRAAGFMRWTAGALVIVIAVWTTVKCWSLASTPAAASGQELLSISRIRSLLGLQVPAVILVSLVYFCIARTRSIVGLTLICLLLGVSAIWMLPSSLMDSQRDGADSEIRAFADWQSAIPLASNVYVAPAHNSATFAWFTLQRPSYLSVDQSAGVVFSRAVAMEVKRRSQVLLPLMQPDWRLLTRAHSNTPSDRPSLPMTSDRLISICRDPQLGFVVAKESVGFDPLRHEHQGNSKDWNLYDCSHVRTLKPGT